MSRRAESVEESGECQGERRLSDEQFWGQHRIDVVSTVSAESLDEIASP